MPTLASPWVTRAPPPALEAGRELDQYGHPCPLDVSTAQHGQKLLAALLPERLANAAVSTARAAACSPSCHCWRSSVCGIPFDAQTFAR